MAIRRLLRGAAFDPEDVTVLVAAYDECLGRLLLRYRDDPVTEIMAKRIIDAALTGERDPRRLCEEALRAIGRGSLTD